MPLQGGAILEFRDAQTLGAQTVPNIGAAITSRAPTTQTSLRKEARSGISSAIRFFRQFLMHGDLPLTDSSVTLVT